MLRQGDELSLIDATTIDVIAERVRAALRDDPEALAAELMGAAPREQLTVEQVARRLGVARSTVYAHWREWGGYKLGSGDKAPIRFDSGALPITKPIRQPREPLTVERRSAPTRRARRRRDVLVGTPRLVQPVDGIS